MEWWVVAGLGLWMLGMTFVGIAVGRLLRRRRRALPQMWTKPKRRED